jgi:crotonobetainyl-CoA:carnitine CoA-transferase CaiB-like acyl-CoA transferase
MPLHEAEYCFLPDNRGKRSLALDLKAPRRAPSCTGWSAAPTCSSPTTGRARSPAWACTWPELQAINPRLVYAHGTGFGDAGEEIDKPGYDTVCYWARSGLEANLFPLEGWPGHVGYGAGDHPAGLALFSSVLLALFARERSGKGTRVSCSLLAAGAYANSVMIQAKLLGAEFQARRPREEAYSFTSVYYRTADKRVFKMAIVNTERDWPKVCRAIGRPELASDPRYATLADRKQQGRMKELIAICDGVFPTQPMDHWKRALEEADIPYSVVGQLRRHRLPIARWRRTACSSRWTTRSSAA